MADETPVMNIVNPPGTGPIIRVDQGAGAGAAIDSMLFETGSAEKFSIDSSGLLDPGGGDPKRAVVVNYGDLPTDPDALEPFIYRWEKAVTITNIFVALDTTLAADGVDFVTLAMTNKTSDATIATLSMTVGLAQNVWLTMGAIGNASIVAGADSYCYLLPAKTASGFALSGLSFRIEYTLAG